MRDAKEQEETCENCGNPQAETGGRGQLAQAFGDDRDQRRRVVVHGDHDGRDDHRPLEMRVVLQHGS